jgi:hypothetical protein
MRMQLALPCVLALAAGVLAQAPLGYKTYENKLAPLTFFYPTAYDELPLPPTEQVTVAKFVLRNRPDDLRKTGIEPQILVFHFEAPPPKTGTVAPGQDKGETAGDKPATVREAMEEKSRVSSWSEFVKRFGNWNLAEAPKKPGHFTLEYKRDWPNDATRPVGYLIRKQEGDTIFDVYGITWVPHEKALQGQLLRVAGSLDLAKEASSAAAEAAIDKLYASGKYRGVEFRKKARRELAKGWRAVDTENYLIVHHSKNETLINQIAREIEAMRALYAELFPPSKQLDSLSVVRVCRTKEEYHSYGGPPNTGGYWHPGNEELVFFDYSYTMKTLDKDEKRALGGRVLTDDDSLLVLYHEAFHQYIHYAIGEFAPHDWFNEGYGDYFSGAVIAGNTGRVLRVDPSPWRIHIAKDMCEHGEGWVPLEQILQAERSTFYHPARIRFFYAGAWSFVYFLKNSKEVAAHAKWSKLLSTYFDTAQREYQDQLAKLGSADLAQKQVVGFQVRKSALTKTLEGIDVAELEKVWRQWVVDMKDPWPSKRKKRNK